MKKVTISTEALEAINEASKQAAKIAAARASSSDKVELFPSLKISLDDMECVLIEAEPASGWTDAVRNDAYQNAKVAYRTHIKRHNVRAYESRGWVLRNFVKDLARDKHTRRRNRHYYSDLAYLLARDEAENKANDQRHHELLVNNIESIIRNRAIAEAGWVSELNVATAQGIVASSIAEAYGDKFAEGRGRQKYLERFTAKEHSYFLDVLRYEFKVAARKNAPAAESESVAD